MVSTTKTDDVEERVENGCTEEKKLTEIKMEENDGPSAENYGVHWAVYIGTTGRG